MEKRSKTKKVTDKLDQAEAMAETAKTFAPPGVRGRIQDAQDAMEMAEVGIGLFGKIKGLFKKK